MSCLLTPDTEELEYMRDLYVQGFIYEGKVHLVLFCVVYAVSVYGN